MYLLKRLYFTSFCKNISENGFMVCFRDGYQNSFQSPIPLWSKSDLAAHINLKVLVDQESQLENPRQSFFTKLTCCKLMEEMHSGNEIPSEVNNFSLYNNCVGNIYGEDYWKVHWISSVISVWQRTESHHDHTEQRHFLWTVQKRSFFQDFIFSLLSWNCLLNMPIGK